MKTAKKYFKICSLLLPSFALLLFAYPNVMAKENALLTIVNKLLTNEANIKQDLEAKPIVAKKTFTPPKTIKGIYMTAYTASGENNRDGKIKQLLESGGNTVVIDIEHGGGKLAFQPKNEWLKTINPGTDTLNDLPELIDSLHKKGIYVIARQVVFSDSYLGNKKPEWRIKNKWGGLYDHRWLDPSKPGVQNYNLYLMIEAAEMGFDEIQFDYIRFPTAYHPSLNYHYDESKFSRADVINDFLKKARRIADAYDVKIGVDVFGAIVYGNIDWKTVGQDAGEMSKYVDVIYPMVYPSHVSPGYYGHNNPYGAPYGFIHDSIERFVKAANGRAEIRTWVQGFPLRIPRFGSWFVNEQVEATYDAAGTGYIIWSPGNIYTLSWPSFGINPPEEEVNALEQGTGPVQ